MESRKITVGMDDVKRNKEKEKEDNKRNLSIDDLRSAEIENTLIDSIKNRGKMTLQDILIMDMVEDRRRKSNKPDVDIDEAIRRSQEPLLKLIDEMKRKQEKDEEEKKYDKLQNQIDKLQELIISANNKKPNDDENPILKQIEALQKELRDEKDASRKKDEDAFRSSIKDMINDLNDQIGDLKDKPQSKDVIEQMIELEAKKQQLAKALNLQPGNKEDDASVIDVVDSLADKVPKWAKTASTVKEVFSKNDEIPDDIPEEVPTSLPQRNIRTDHVSNIPADIKEFLDKGRDTDKGYVDYSNTPWINLEGEPIKRRDIEDLALTNPEDVRRLIKDADEAYMKQQEQKKEPKKNPDDIKIDHVHTSPIPEKTEPPKKEEPEPKEPEKPEEEADAKEEPPDTMKEAIDYINTGNDKTDNDGNTVWVGQKNEMYMTDDGKPASKEQLMAMAEDDPDGFMQVVHEHLKSLSGENGQ